MYHFKNLCKNFVNLHTRRSVNFSQLNLKTTRVRSLNFVNTGAWKSQSIYSILTLGRKFRYLCLKIEILSQDLKYLYREIIGFFFKYETCQSKYHVKKKFS